MSMNRKLTILAIVVMLAMIPFFYRSGEAKAVSYPSLEWSVGHNLLLETEAIAAKNGAIHLVYFYTDWCGYCKQFDREILASPSLRKELNNVVKIRINPEDSDEAAEVMARFNANGFPTVFAKSPGENEYREVSPFEPTLSAGGKTVWKMTTVDEFISNVRGK